MVWKAVLKLLNRERPGDSADLDWLVTDNDQPPGGKEGDRPIRMVVGVDFGTSFSKVVVGATQVHYAVPFKRYAVGENPLLLPSALCVVPDVNECLLGTDPQGGVLYDNLKMPLIERNFSDEVQRRGTAFLALVFRHTRGWLFETHGSTYKGRKIQWFINVGVPTDSYDDEVLISTYRSIVQAAWRISVLPGPVTLSRARVYLTLDETKLDKLPARYADRLLPDDRISAFPEFSAQLAGYVRSPRRQDGLHAMVDVGGGTLDVTVFNVMQRDNEHVFPIFARRVAPLGARYLTEARLHALPKEAARAYSPFEDLPSDTAFRKKYGIARIQLENTDESFRARVRSTVAGTLQYTKQHRYPTAPQWDRTSVRYGEALPSFFGGGGVLSDFYATLLRGFEGRRPPFRLRGSPLPVPDDLKAPGMIPNAYARLAVAYGLSFDPFDIGQIRRMSEIDEFHPEVRPTNYRDRYTGSELT